MGSNEIASSHLEGLIVSKPASGAPEINVFFIMRIYGLLRCK